MPLSGGTSGAHDDAMHQGNAKRDVAGGVVGLTPSGDISIDGSIICMTRNTSHNITICDALSGDYVTYYNRVGADDYVGYLKVVGGWEKIQHAGMKDVVDGIAALDAAGSLLLPGSKMYYTRDGLNDVHIYERTSNEEAYAFHRVGADDYTFFVKESNVWKRMQTESMKDAANGIAGLDANILLSPALLPPCMEEYSNHLGAVDNFTQIITNGNGTATTDAANHEMDLSSGVTVAGHGGFNTKKSFTPSTKPIVCNIILDNFVEGAGGGRGLFMGFSDNWSGIVASHHAFIRDTPGVGWIASSYDGVAIQTTNISPFTDGDLISIILTSSKIIYCKNGTIIATHSTRIPTNAVSTGALVQATPVAATTAITVSIDYVSVKRYV